MKNTTENYGDSSRISTVSVIIPCKQAERTLALCLGSLFKQSSPPLEIIVVNDGSTDRTEEIAKEFDVILKNTKQGSGAGAARKTGAEVAKGEVLAFLDSDCEAPSDWIEKIISNFSQDPTLGAVGGGYSHPPMKSLIGKLVALEEEYCHNQFYLHSTISNPPGGNFALRKVHWKSLRTSRELYYFAGMASGEDSVFCEELRQITNVRFDHRMTVCHHTNEASRYFTRHINRGRSRMSIRLNKLVSPCDNKMTMQAYGGMKLVWASVVTWFMLGSLAAVPFVGGGALIAAALLALVHLGLSNEYFSFAKKQSSEENSANPISLWESIGLRAALAIRLVCWGIGASWAIKVYSARNIKKWLNIGLSVLHFWRPGRVSKLFFFVTSKCNARCNFCFNLDNVINWDKRKNKELSLDEITQIAKNFKRLPYITLSGGEPFIRQDIVDVIDAFYTHSKTQWITIPSNAALTSVCLEKTVQILNRCPNLFLTVQASIDSLDEDHNKSRNIRDGFNKMSETLKGWAWLCQFYPNLRIQLATAYDDFNKERINEIIAYCRENYNVHQQMLYLIRDAHTTITQSNNHLMPSYFNLIDNINNYEAKQKGTSNSFWHKTVSVIQKQVSNDIFLIKKDKKFLRPCHATQKFFTLYDDGQVSPCEVLDKTTLGNIREFNLDYYALKEHREINQYYKKEILDKKCNCDWMCATPINMLYDVKSLSSIAKGFFVSKPLGFKRELEKEIPQHVPERTYNQDQDTWDRVQNHREKTHDHVTSSIPKTAPPAPRSQPPSHPAG